MTNSNHETLRRMAAHRREDDQRPASPCPGPGRDEERCRACGGGCAALLARLDLRHEAALEA